MNGLVNEGQFKTSLFGGFERDSVLRFVNELIDKNTAAEAEYRRRIEELTEQVQSAEGRNTDFEKRVARLEENLVEKDSRLNQAEALAQELTVQVQKQATQLREKDREVQIQTERNRQLQNKAEEMEQKSKKYDTVSGEIGNMMLEAKKNAALIEQQARASVQDIVADAHNNAAAVLAQFQTLQGDLQTLRQGIDGAHRMFINRLDELERTISQAFVTLQAGEPKEEAPRREQPPQAEARPRVAAPAPQEREAPRRKELPRQPEEDPTAWFFR